MKTKTPRGYRGVYRNRNGKLMMTTAAAATRAGVELAFFRDATEFNGFAYHGDNRLLHLLHVFLGIEETARDRVAEERFAELLEVGDFSAIQRHAGLLFLLQGLALHHQGVVLTAGLFIGHERFNFLTHGLKFGLIKNGLAKFPGLLCNDAFFDLSLHNLVYCAARRPLAVATSQRTIIQHKRGEKSTYSSIQATEAGLIKETDIFTGCNLGKTVCVMKVGNL